MKVKKGANTFVTEQAKYSYESSWNKKKTVKTYSKSRPHLVQTQSPDIFDDVFEEEGGVEGADQMNKENEAHFSIESQTQNKDVQENRDVALPNHKPFEVLSSNAVLDDNTENDLANKENVTGEEEGIDTSPKNSTCIEGGARIENQQIYEPKLSPIHDLRVEKTNMDNVSMELTSPCISDKFNSSPCLSTIGGSSPYILAALRVKRRRKSRKASMAPFIKQRLKNLRKERLLSKKKFGSSSYFLTRRKEKSKEIQSSQSQSSSSSQKEICISQEKELEQGPSPILPLTIDPETTPEDKNLSVLLKKDPASIKSRRSLNYTKKSNVPIDFLLTEPVNLDFKKVK